MSNIEHHTDQELHDAATVAERANDWRSLDAILSELKARQDAARHRDLDTIRQVAERYSERGLQL